MHPIVYRIIRSNYLYVKSDILYIGLTITLSIIFAYILQIITQPIISQVIKYSNKKQQNH